MSRNVSPSVVVLAGPNGAGKSTIAPTLLKGTLAVTEFVNADTIARGLSGFAPERSGLEAGKIMLGRVRELARRREDFAFETTLASRSFAPWLKDLRGEGYAVHLVFLWLPSADFAVRRVAERVAMGGHDSPEETVRRRYLAGLRNLFGLYLPLTATWRLLDNSQAGDPRPVAVGSGSQVLRAFDPGLWSRIEKEGRHAQ
jgi:predicted ABC-type ATPase